MSQLRIAVSRGDLVESVHRLSVAVVGADGRMLAAAGNPDLVTYWRSAAKPFQALPLLQDGAADRFGFTDAELALASASHSSEPVHLATVDGMLGKLGLSENLLACGPHPPLSPEVEEAVLRAGIQLTPRWSNCSGKHAGMLAAALHQGWPLAGYERLGHPLQERILREVERWTGLDREAMRLGIDGCRVVCFGLPLRAMALAYARFGVSTEAEPRRLWRATTGHPHLVAGSKRLDTEMMEAWPGEVFVKVGAEGVYSAAVPSRSFGVAVKVEDGAGRAAPLALLAVLRAMLARSDGGGPVLDALDGLAAYRSVPVLDTRGDQVGDIRPVGELEFFAS